IRDLIVTGVQTCALPISPNLAQLAVSSQSHLCARAVAPPSTRSGLRLTGNFGMSSVPLPWPVWPPVPSRAAPIPWQRRARRPERGDGLAYRTCEQASLLTPRFQTTDSPLTTRRPKRQDEAASPPRPASN